MDPNILKLFGRPVFSGSGRPSDYFGEPMDLGYLGGPRPEFIPDEHDYNPELDPEQLIRSGIPVPMAMQVQQARAALHQKAAEDRVRADSQAALRELEKVDYSSPKAGNALTKIFSKFPNARRNPEVIESVNFMKALKPQSETFDIETIADPILYTKAQKEKWADLPKSEVQRKMGAYEHNRKILAQAIENGLGEADLVDALDPEAGIYDPLKVSAKLKAGRYDPSEETDPRMAHIAITQGWDKLGKAEAARKRTAAMLNLGIEDEAEAMGVPSEELAPFLDKDTGVYDMGKVKGHLRQYTSKLKTHPTAEIAKYTERAAQEREALLSDESKLAYLQKKHGDDKRTDFPKAEWDEAYATLSAQPVPAEKALEAIQAAMGGRPKAKPQSTEAKSSGPPTINSQAEYDALPKGATYIDSKGKQATKN
jgi:hypothetical protein